MSEKGIALTIDPDQIPTMLTALMSLTELMEMTVDEALEGIKKGDTKEAIDLLTIMCKNIKPCVMAAITTCIDIKKVTREEAEAMRGDDKFTELLKRMPTERMTPQ